VLRSAYGRRGKVAYLEACRHADTLCDEERQSVAGGQLTLDVEDDQGARVTAAGRPTTVVALPQNQQKQSRHEASSAVPDNSRAQ